MGKKSKLVALLVVICMVATMLPTVPMEEYEASEKVGSELLELMGVTYADLTSGNYVDSGETYSCIIWIEDVEIEEAVEAGIDAAEMTREGYSTWSLYDYPYTTYESDGLTYVDVTFDETESDEYVQTYIEAEREAAAELYSANNSSFVAENFMARDMSVTYVSKYSPCVFADLSVTKVAELVNQQEVTHIGFWKEDNYGNASEDISIHLDWDEIQENIATIRANEAQEDYNVTGAGVKIGQIEITCPDDDEIVKNPDYNDLSLAEVDEHSDNVYWIMTEVAPDAEYYATGMYPSDESYEIGTFYEQVEWLLSQGVNVINHSGGYSNYYNYYGQREQWIDHIAYNHDVHFVQISGNEGKTGVISPGMAYNIVTVGCTYSDSPYIIWDDSSYNTYVNRLQFRTYKPDVVAPGTYTADSGTSYAAPLVTGTIALMCEYEPTLKVKQHTVKAILAASTGKETGKYVTMDDDYMQYGAGMIDAKAALWVIKKDNFTFTTGTLSNSVTIKKYSMTVTSSDTCMRIALAYANRIEFASGDNHSLENIPATGIPIAEVNLAVYAPDGQKVASYTGTSGANLKIVEFDPREYGIGTYTIQVALAVPREDGKNTNFGVAWR